MSRTLLYWFATGLLIPIPLLMLRPPDLIMLVLWPSSIFLLGNEIRPLSDAVVVIVVSAALNGGYYLVMFALVHAIRYLVARTGAA